MMLLFESRKAFFKISDEVVDVLDANGKADGIRLDPRLEKFLYGKPECIAGAGWITRLLTSATFSSREKVSGLSMNFHVSACSPLISRVKIEAPPFREVLLVQLVLRMSGQRRMIDLLHQQMICQIFYDFFLVLRVTFKPQGKGLDTLKEQKLLMMILLIV